MARAGLAATVPVVAALVAIDVVTRRLPRVLSYAGVGLALPLLLWAPHPMRADRWGPALGAGAMVAVAAVVRTVSRGALGLGDVHAAPLIGAVVGWFDPGRVATVWAAAALCGGVIALVVLAAGRGRDTRVPYGPALFAGLCAAIVLA